MDEVIEQVPAIVDAIQARNCTRQDAISVLIQLVRTAHSAGVVRGTDEAGTRMLQTLDKVFAKPATV